MSNFEKVREFMNAFGQEAVTTPSWPDAKTIGLRYELIREELEQKFVENTKFGLGTKHVWFPMITKFMMNGQISLTL